MSNMVNSMSVLHAQGIGKHFREGDINLKVLDNINLQVQRGQTLAIVGASGSGKSTLLHILGALDVPSLGKVYLQGVDVHRLNPSEQGKMRNEYLGFVYQFHHLQREFIALDNVAMPLFIRGMDRVSAHAMAKKMLEQVGLGARLMHRPSQLSGGERQRVAIARALVTNPACVLADEPTGNLDKQTAQTIFTLMLDLAREQGTAFIVVTHDETLAKQCQIHMRLDLGTLQPSGM